jgi:dihydrofolate reductase
MGKIVVHEFISLDGVIEDPTFTFEYPFVPKMGEAIAQAMGPCNAILLGRRTFEMFAPAWSKRTAAEDPGAPFMNNSPKYVVSSTLKNGDIWQNSEIIGAYDAETIRAIKDSVDGGLYVSGSGALVRALLADGLVDELHLFIYPVALGKSGRLFAESGDLKKFTLARSEAFENGVLLAVYQPRPADSA